MNRRILTENGWVRGLPGTDARITAFKGIPFAAPPVGENRWRAPQPCENWAGDLNAYEFGPISMQDVGKPGRENFFHREWAVDFELPMSEDCLYLNIWSPVEGHPIGVGEQFRQTEDEPVPEAGHLPVLVWFFGGGLTVGNTTEMTHDGERLARRGIVVVTVNYRLNVFGFLTHKDLAEEAPDAPANFGLLDQQAAIKWVKRNIEAFGGDPENITIGGQSSGGSAVCAHLANPDNRGLFQKAILTSGIFFPAYSPRPFFRSDLATAQASGAAFLEKLGVTTIEEARKIDAQTILNIYKEGKYSHFSFNNCVDGVYSKAAANDWFLQKDHVECPLFVSSTNIEMVMSPRDVENAASLRALAEQLPGMDVEAFMQAFGGADDAQRIKEKGAVSGIDLAIHCMSAILGDKNPIFAAQFSGEMPGWDHPGAYHSSDLWFYFETLANCWRPFVGKHYDIARKMCDCWAKFMWNGSPNGTGTDWQSLPHWEKTTSEKPVRMEFGEEAIVRENPPSELMRVLINAYLGTHQAAE
jgi:para-nitrobenzyl esterase